MTKKDCGPTDIRATDAIPDYVSTPIHLVDQGFYRWPAGPKIWEVCDTCNVIGHRCHFCGDDLRHAETLRGPNMHACYWPDPSTTDNVEEPK